MSHARAVIAAVLATGLVIIVIVQEIGASIFAIAFPDVLVENDAGWVIDTTFLLLAISIIILVVPDAIAYFRHKNKEEDSEDG